MFSQFLPSHLVPFAELSPWLIGAVALAHFAGFFIRGAFGFGSNMPIVLATTWLLSPHHAIILVMLTATAAQVHLMPQGVRAADWRVVWTVTPGLAFGIVVGTWLFAELEADGLILVMAALIIFILLLDRFHLIERISALLPIRSPLTATTLAAIGSTAGTVCGGGTVYFLVVYFKLVCRTAQALRGTNIAISGLFVITRVAAIAVTGLIAPRYLIEAALLLPVVILGTWSGSRAFHRSSPERFYLALQILLFLAALALIGKGLFAVL